jgi:hypothetical protein
MIRASILENESLDGLLVRLAEAYESDPSTYVVVGRKTIIPHDILKRYLDSLRAVGWLRIRYGNGYSLTPAGYRSLKPHIHAVRDQRQRELQRTLLEKVHRSKPYSPTQILAF